MAPVLLNIYYYYYYYYINRLLLGMILIKKTVKPQQKELEQNFKSQNVDILLLSTTHVYNSVINMTYSRIHIF